MSRQIDITCMKIYKTESITGQTENIPTRQTENIPRQLDTCLDLQPYSQWTARTDKKYMELNGAALNVNIPRVTSR